MDLLLIEDNKSIQKVIQAILDEHPRFNLLAIGSTVEEGKELLKIHSPDLVLLDVELPDGKSFDLLQTISEPSFHVIFITAHEKYALRAIKFSALDYLLKPIDEDELIEAIEKAENNLEAESSSIKLDVLLQNLKNSDQSDKLILNDQYGIQIVQISDIIRLESGGSYTKFVISEMEDVVVSKGLKHFEKMLPQKHFFRSHQSHIINLNWLKRYDKREGDQLFLANGDKVPLASRKKERMLEILKAI